MDAGGDYTAGSANTSPGQPKTPPFEPIESGGFGGQFRLLRGYPQSCDLTVKNPNVFDHRRSGLAQRPEHRHGVGIVPFVIHRAAVDFDTPQASAA